MLSAAVGDDLPVALVFSYERSVDLAAIVLIAIELPDTALAKIGAKGKQTFANVKLTGRQNPWGTYSAAGITNL